MVIDSASVGLSGLQTVTIEPDDFPNNTVLNNTSPFVTLSTANANHKPVFNVTSLSNMDDATTGKRVFGAATVPFWNADRILRMDFHAPAVSISIDYRSSGFRSGNFVGLLEAYDSHGVLLGRDTTFPLIGHSFETMTVQASGIAFALAYPPDDPFGDLDHLVFTVPIPEPSTLALATLGAVGLLTAARRKVMAPTP